MGDAYPQKKNFINNTGRITLVFLTGLGIGARLAAVFAPRSGEETREWIADRSDSSRTRQIEGEERVTDILRNGKKALESVAAKLD